MKESRRGGEEGTRVDMNSFDFAPCTSEDLKGGLLGRGERLRLFDHQRKVSLASWFAVGGGYLLAGLPREGGRLLLFLPRGGVTCFLDSPFVNLCKLVHVHVYDHFLIY